MVSFSKIMTTTLALWATSCAAIPLLDHKHQEHKRAGYTKLVTRVKVMTATEVVYVDADGNLVNAEQNVATETTEAESTKATETIQAATSTSGKATTKAITKETTTKATTTSKASTTTSAVLGAKKEEEEELSSTVAATTTLETTSSSTTEATTITKETTSSSSKTRGTTSTTKKTAATGTTTLATSTTSSEESSSTSSSSSDSDSDSDSTVYTGDGTYYNPGLGSCGVTNDDDDYIVALSKYLYDTKNTGNPNNNPFCGQKIKVTRGGKSTTVTVVDRCFACKEYDLDLSPAAFNEIADEADGRVKISWEWVN